MLRRLTGALVAAAALLALPAAASAGMSAAPFGHPCTAQNGVRFCPTTDLSQRVPSFDGLPIDVDVTLPATGAGPFPTIAMLHGYGGNKGAYETSDANPATMTNVGMARRGYAVVTISARGFGRSCGSPASRTAECAKGWIHLGDQRYEARDTQVLLGKLVDERIAKAGALGVTGGSYGGGQSMELGFLRDRVRLPNGTFAPWTSPNGTKLAINASYPVIPWSDLADSLVPNGRNNLTPADMIKPIGVPIESYINALYNGGAASGFVAPPGADAGADLQNWRDLFNAGEPYGAQAKAVAKEMSEYHGSLALGSKAAPMLLTNGWTDDLFPVWQSLRVYNKLRKVSKKAPVWLAYGDLGHPRGGNHANDQKGLETLAASFFDVYLKGAAKSTLPKPGSVVAYGQTCPRKGPSGLGPFKASSWDTLTRKSVTVKSSRTQMVSSAGGDLALSTSLDPIAGKGADACNTYAAKVDPGTATATATSKGFTYLGIGHISATVKTSGRNGQLAARLWDVSGATQTLVDRSVYRLTDNQKGKVTFDLHGNGYRFPAGHIVKLELVGNDAPMHRASNTAFSVKVGKLSVRLPSR